MSQLGSVEVVHTKLTCKQPAVGTDPDFLRRVEQRVINLILCTNEQVAKADAVVEPLIESRGEITVRPE